MILLSLKSDIIYGNYLTKKFTNNSFNPFMYLDMQKSFSSRAIKKFGLFLSEN